MASSPRPERPIPIINALRCTGCGLCVTACPTGTLAISRGRAYVARPDRCDYFGYCERICPVRAIERPFQIVAPAGYEKEKHTMQQEKFYWPDEITFSAGAPQPQPLLEDDHLKFVLVGLEPLQQIPPHPVPSAVYYFIEGNGWMTVDDDQFEVEPGLIVRTPDGANRSIEANTRLVFLGAHSKPAGHNTPE